MPTSLPTIPSILPAPTNFHLCQLCGFTSDDICEFRMWQRCDEKDKPINEYFIACQRKECRKLIDDDSMLFMEVPWSNGGPGRFMLLCGDCPSRKGWTCQHPNLKSNGGKGLLVNFAQTFMSQVRICFSNGTSMGGEPPPANRCEGHPDPNRKPTKDVER